jgi:hypothetical protein
MPRTPMYAEGLEQLSLSVPATVKDGLRRYAVDERLSMSQVVTVALEEWLRRRGYLREREGVAV